MWTWVFDSASTDEAVEHLDTLLSNIANDKLPRWFMQATHASNLLAIVKEYHFGPEYHFGSEYHPCSRFAYQPHTTNFIILIKSPFDLAVEIVN
jgi:hypothetical protein